MGRVIPVLCQNHRRRTRCIVVPVLYAACGALPYLAAGTEKRMVAAAFWGFGIGGAAAGELVAILVMSDNLASHARVLGAFAIPATIPWLLGFFMTRWLAAGWT